MVNKDYQKLFDANSPLEDFLNHPQWKSWINSDIFVYQLINKTTFDKFDSLPQEIVSKPGIILSALEKFFLNNKLINGSLSEDKSFFMYCCNLDPKYATLFPELLKKEEELVIWYCKEFSKLVIAPYLPSPYLNDKYFATILLKDNIGNYGHLSESLRNNISIYKSLSPKNQIEAFPFVGEQLSSDFSIASFIVIKEPSNYKYVHESLQKKSTFYLNILSKLSLEIDIEELLKTAPEIIRDNEHCVWQTVLQAPKSLMFASERLLNSVSFAEQVISSMNSEQISKSIEYWSLHVKNNAIVFEELLPKIVKAGALNLLGPNLKENMGFMLKAALLDSEQTLECCASKLLGNSLFIINCYHQIDEKNKHKGRYDEFSEQSKIFNYITQDSTNDPIFISSLYKELHDIFITIAYPKIKKNNTPLIQYLNVQEKKNNGLVEALEKLLLHDNLDKQLDNQNQPKKKPKI